MSASTARLYFDFLDPLSYLIGRELDRLTEDDVELPRWVGLELRPPPAPLSTQDDPRLAHRWAEARELAPSLDVEFAPPELAPWTRKAHEFVYHAAGHDQESAARNAIFEAYLLSGLDIGRVDVLVGLARDLGLDPTETKAVLDVDRFEATVVEAAKDAVRAGIEDVPTIVRGSGRLEGFHNHPTLGTFLRR